MLLSALFEGPGRRAHAFFQLDRRCGRVGRSHDISELRDEPVDRIVTRHRSHCGEMTMRCGVVPESDRNGPWRNFGMRCRSALAPPRRAFTRVLNRFACSASYHPARVVPDVTRLLVAYQYVHKLECSLRSNRRRLLQLASRRNWKTHSLPTHWQPH